MKIAIIGTHSTGKTTLVAKLKERLSKMGIDTPILSELSRSCPFNINQKTSFEAQSWIQKQHIILENQVEHNGRIFICDRATLDNFAYFERAVKDRDISVWEIRAASHMNTYDFVFKTVKLDVAAEYDGTRAIEEDFRQDIDNRINALIQKYSTKYHLLPATTDYDTHVKFIFEKINPFAFAPSSVVRVPQVAMVG